MITETLGGKAMVWCQISSVKAWSVASAIFAANATGNAQAFLRNPSLSSVWETIEFPILQFLHHADIIYK